MKRKMIKNNLNNLSNNKYLNFSKKYQAEGIKMLNLSKSFLNNIKKTLKRK